MTMQAILDFARDHFTAILIAAIIGTFGGFIWTLINDTRRHHRTVKKTVDGIVDGVRRAEAFKTEAIRLLESGLELMSPAQVEQWAGVREFLRAYGGQSAKGEDEDMRQPFTLRNADKDLTHPGYPPEYSLTSAEIADRLRVGILDLEEPGDADAGFPDWEPKARPF